jgi:hypothetical protein
MSMMQIKITDEKSTQFFRTIFIPSEEARVSKRHSRSPQNSGGSFQTEEDTPCRVRGHRDWADRRRQPGDFMVVFPILPKGGKVAKLNP